MNVVVPLARELPPPAPDDELLSFTVTPSGDAMTMWASPEGRAALTGQTTRGMGVFPQSAPARYVDARVAHDNTQARTSTRVLQVPTSFPSAHALPGDKVLVVGARAAWSTDGPEHNGHVYDSEGRLIRSACLGDGIARVVTTTEGRIWVGYFDEGVFGNFGWGGPGPEPIGASGLNLFDDALDLILSNDTVDIVDCYALGGDGEGVLACAYTRWDIGRFAPDGSVIAFANADTRGAVAIAREGDVVMLVGGYGDDRNRIVMGRLVDTPTGSRSVRPLARGRLTLPDGTWDVDDVVGRDGVLHVRAGTGWFRSSVREVCTALGMVSS